MKTQTFLLLVSLLICSISLLMCSNDDDDDDNNDGGPDSEDLFEKAHCEGYDLPECGTEADLPPHLNSVTMLVDGMVVNQPVSISSDSELIFSIEYSIPGSQLCGGHIFITKGGKDYCLDKTSGQLSDEAFPMELPGICSTEAYGQPVTFPVDPSIFLNGEGAPYFLEISNACATHSNSLLLDIVTVAE